MGSRVRTLLLAGGAGLLLVAALTALLALLLGTPDGIGPLVFLAWFFLIVVVLPVAAVLRRSPPRRHPGRKVDPERVAAVRAAHAPGWRARLRSLLRFAAFAIVYAALFVLGTWAMTEAFSSWLFIPACLFVYGVMVHLAYRVTHERHLKMRSLGPRTSTRVRHFQRKEIKNPKVSSKWEV